MDAIGRRKISVKVAVTLLVLGSAILVAMPLHWLWWRTARASSLQLVEELSSQVASNARQEFWNCVVAAEAAFRVTASLIRPNGGDESARSALIAGLTSSEIPSAIAFAAARGGRLTAVRDKDRKAIVDDRSWSMPEGAGQAPRWVGPVADPAGGGTAVAYNGSAGSEGSVSVFIGLDRFSALLSAIPVGRTGAVFVIDPEGSSPIAADRMRAERLAPVVQAAAEVVKARPATAVNIFESRRLLVAGEAYRVFLSPLEFKGWQLAAIIPEADYLTEINQLVQRAFVTLIALALVLGLLASLLAQRIIARPLGGLIDDLEKIRRFDLEAISHRRLALREFDELSDALSRMAKGLADFGKFIPTDLVRTLLAHGDRAVAGGSTRPVTVMFADVAKFTAMSERLGSEVVGIVSRYLDVASHEIEANGGVVDKYIGDAVMALWGAPSDDELQAAHACYAALAIMRGIKKAEIVDDLGMPLSIRIGIHSGLAVVGNIGSDRRLNYTAIGDTVNLASRIEGVNKVFQTSILISDATRRAAGDRIVAREIVEIAVVGKSKGERVHELLDIAQGSSKPGWVLRYERALEAYRRMDFAMAADGLNAVLVERPGDGPAIWLLAECARRLLAPPGPGWSPVLVLDTK